MDFQWGHSGLTLSFEVDANRRVRLAGFGAPAHRWGPGTGPDSAALGVSLVEVQLAGSGRRTSGERSLHSAAGSGLEYLGHEETGDGDWLRLRVDLADPATGLAARAHFRSPHGVATVQCWVELRNTGDRRLVVESVTSFAIGGLTGGGDGRFGALDVWCADNEWLAEGRWRRRPLGEVLVDLNFGAHRQDPHGCFFLASQGSWSSGRYLPMGALTAPGSGALVWQIENPGGWRWEVGERFEAGYLALLGPTDRDHQWRQALEPGASFTSVPVAVACGTPAAGGSGSESGFGFAEAVAALTAYRRVLRRPHPDHAALPVVFNDFMNTLMGDPTTDRLLPLIDAAAEAGAEYFVIDAGWYDDTDGWWDSVGAWQPSTVRFPGGLAEVTSRITASGMVPGLWLEPEVVGVRSPVARRLPDEAFFRRDGIRVVDTGRYHLDLRHPAAVAHLDEAVDRLVGEFGVGYFKLDYNINPGPGTDVGGGSAGNGLLGHQRALLDWLDSVLQRHPGLVLENCGSGGMRTDYAMLARTQLQSTSDQQDPRRYPPIAAAAPVAVAPEQGAAWAYPQPEFSDDEIAFTLCNALLGRIHLSGHLNRMSAEQHAVVAQGIDVYKAIRAELAGAAPFWPLGLPGWDDPWVALGMRAPGTSYMTVWRRAETSDGDGDADKGSLPIPHLAGHEVEVSVLFPSSGKAETRWSAATGTLEVRLPAANTACLIALVSPAGPDGAR